MKFFVILAIIKKNRLTRIIKSETGLLPEIILELLN